MAYNGLYAKYSPVITSYINSLVPGIEAFYKEEIHALTMGKAFLKLKQYQPTYPFPVWLKSIARNNTIDFLRRNKMKYCPLEKLEIANYDAPDCALEEKDTYRRIQKFIGGQSALHQEVLNMRYRGMKCTEISKSLRVPMGTISTILYRSRIRLKTLI